LKSFFSELKKILEKHEDDIVCENSKATISQARFAEKNGKFVRYLFVVFDSIQNGI